MTAPNDETNTPIPPLPQVGGGYFAAAGRQPWQLAPVQNLLDAVSHGTLLLCVMCEGATPADHRRCLRFVAFRRWLPALTIGVCLVVGFSIIVKLASTMDSSGSGDGGMLFTLFLASLGGSSLAIFWGLLLAGIERAVSDPRNAGGASDLFCVTTATTIHRVMGERRDAVSWHNVRWAIEWGGDVFIHWSEGERVGYLYLPRCAFADRVHALLFRDAIEALAKAKGDPAVLTEEMRVAFPVSGGSF